MQVLKFQVLGGRTNQEGGGVSRQISGLVITTSVTSHHTSVIFDMAAKFLGSLTE